MRDPRLTVTDAEYVMSFYSISSDAITFSISDPLLHLQFNQHRRSLSAHRRPYDDCLILVSWDIDRASLLGCLGMKWSTTNTLSAHCSILGVWPHPACTIIIHSPMQSLSHDPYELRCHDKQTSDPIRSTHLMRDISLRIHREFLIPPKPQATHFVVYLDWYRYRAYLSFYEMMRRNVSDYGLHTRRDSYCSVASANRSMSATSLIDNPISVSKYTSQNF